MTLHSYAPFLSAGDFADIYIEESDTLSIRWEEGRVDAVSRTEDSGAGLRFIKGRETRFGHTDLVRPLAGLDNAQSPKVRRLAEQLGVGFPKIQFQSSALPTMRAHPVKISPKDLSLEQKIQMIGQAYRAANTGPHLRQVTINYGEKIKKVGYLNSDGDFFLEERTYVVFSVTVTVERSGDMQTAYESLGGLAGLELYSQGQMDALAALASQRAHRKLSAPQAPVGEMPVVIASSSGGTLIHEAIGHSLEADAVLEGTSPAFSGKLGSVVANEKLVVYDNPTVEGARGSFFYDDEGVPAEATKLVDNGVLKDYLYDRLSAKRAGRKSNGHGRRESYAHRPIPRMSNTYVAPGPDDPAKILSEFKNGLLVTRMGGGQVNTANGDFVFEVEEGFHVKDGEKKLVRGATLLGNGPETLRLIDQIGSDHGWAIGTCGKEGQGVPVSDALPTVHIQKLVVGGQ